MGGIRYWKVEVHMSDTARLIISLKNSENQRLREIPTRIALHRDDQKMGNTITRNFVAPREAFDLPVFPLGTWRCDVDPARYETRGFFFPVRPNKPPVEKDLWLPRRVRAGWNAKFARWNQLEPRYGPLKKLLDKSPRLQLKIKGSGQKRPLGRFAGATYDDIDERHLIEGKVGMLNLYAKMMATPVPGANARRWFFGLQELLVIQRDRIIGIASSSMAKLIWKIAQQPDFFPMYGKAPATLHVKNIEAGIAALNLPEPVQRGKLYSIKSRDRIGVLQLTIGPVKNSAGETRFILDADIDENGNLLKHFGDTIKHRFNGGTHPFHVYDILHRALEKPLLGYHLV
jgi:hypothetical protein